MSLTSCNTSVWWRSGTEPFEYSELCHVQITPYLSSNQNLLQILFQLSSYACTKIPTSEWLCQNTDFPTLKSVSWCSLNNTSTIENTQSHGRRGPTKKISEMSPCLLHRRDLARGHCLPVIHLKLCAESGPHGGWTITIPFPRPQFSPTALPLTSLSTSGTLLPLSEENIWLAAARMHEDMGWRWFWDWQKLKTPTVFSAAGRQTGKSKAHLHLHSAYLFFLVSPTLAELTQLPMNHHQVSYGVIP